MPNIPNAFFAIFIHFCVDSCIRTSVWIFSWPDRWIPYLLRHVAFLIFDLNFFLWSFFSGNGPRLLIARRQRKIIPRNDFFQTPTESLIPRPAPFNETIHQGFFSLPLEVFLKESRGCWIMGLKRENAFFIWCPGKVMPGHLGLFYFFTKQMSFSLKTHEFPKKGNMHRNERGRILNRR